MDYHVENSNCFLKFPQTIMPGSMLREREITLSWKRVQCHWTHAMKGTELTGTDPFTNEVPHGHHLFDASRAVSGSRFGLEPMPSWPPP